MSKKSTDNEEDIEFEGAMRQDSECEHTGRYLQRPENQYPLHYFNYMIIYYTKLKLSKSLVFLISLIFTQGVVAMKLTSTVFTDGDNLPSKYTCDGENISPPIAWTGAPTNTKSFVLIYDDPDAPKGTWDHWILYNLPPTTKSLPENATSLPPGTKVGLNSWPKAEYGGPCPPSGEHRYIFHLYALDTMLDLSGKVTSSTLRKAMKGHILNTTTLTGLYRRPNQ